MARIQTQLFGSTLVLKLGVWQRIQKYKLERFGGRIGCYLHRHSPRLIIPFISEAF